MKRIALSLATIAVVLGLVVFSLVRFGTTGATGEASVEEDTSSANGCWHTTGLELADNDEPYGRGYSGVTATWSTPDWKPGEVLQGSRLGLHLKQSKAKKALMRWDLTNTGGNHPEPELQPDPCDISKVSKQIVITKLVYRHRCGCHTCNLLGSTIRRYDVNRDGKLQLSEINGRCIQLGILGGRCGEYGELLMDFQFSPDAGNAFQGDVTTAKVTISVS